MRAILSFLHYLLAISYFCGQTQALPVSTTPLHTANVSHAFPLFTSDQERLHARSDAVVVYGLPDPWQGIFRSIKYILPSLPQSCFTHFFLTVYDKARGDPVPGRPYQRFTYGALVLEFMAQATDGQAQVVTKEFVEAAALWLFDAARQGWTDFFEAKILNPESQEVVYVHMSNVWDAWAKQGYLDEFLLAFHQS